jgi:hypothetical protein
MKKSAKQQFKEAYNEIMSDFGKDYLDIVKVNWLDTRCILDTFSLKEISQEKLIDVISIGYLISEDEDLIKICNFIFPDMQHDIQDYNGQTGFRNTLIIPKKMIKSILSLRIDFEESKKWRKDEKEK